MRKPINNPSKMCDEPIRTCSHLYNEVFGIETLCNDYGSSLLWLYFLPVKGETVLEIFWPRKVFKTEEFTLLGFMVKRTSE